MPNNTETRSIPTVGIYTPKGTEFKYPTITLNPDSKDPFRFGIKKARLIVEQFDHIKKFVEDNPDAEG